MANCTNCGAPLVEGTKFCTSCGSPLPADAASAAQPAVDATQPQPYQQPQFQQQQQPYQQPQFAQPQYAQQQPKNATTYIVLSVLEFLFLGGLLAIIPFVFAIQANSAYSAGDIAGGDAKANTAKTALIVVAVIGVVIYLGLFAMGGCAALYR